MGNPTIGYVGNIEEETLANSNFRKVLHTGAHSQLVVMSLKPGEEIGMEIHNENDQFFRIDAGHGKIIMNGVESEVSDGFAIVVPAGVEHNLINLSDTEPLKLYTIYSPAHHAPGTVHEVKPLRD